MADSGVVAPSSRKSLVHDPDFLKFWIGQSVSVFGAQFSPLAIGAIAYYTLKATSFQFGILQFLNTIPFLTLGLLVGVYVDRHRRRRIMILADLGRALVLFSIPLSAILLALMSMNLLYAVTLLAGVLTLFFEIAYQSYVPSLVEKPQIAEANSKLEATRALSQTAGPSVAGVLLNIVSKPLVVLGDTLGYLTSFASLTLIEKPDPVGSSGPPKSTWQDVREGLALVYRDKRLRSIAATTGTLNFFGSAFQAISVYYFYNNLGMDPQEVGIAFGIGSLGGVLGALVATRVAKRIGVGRATILGAILSSFVWIIVYFASPTDAFILVTVVNFVSSIGVLIYNIAQVSYRQALVARELQGRMNATMRTIVWGVIPLGGLMGGILSISLGVQQTVGLTIILASLGFLWLVFSPMRSVKEFPQE